MATKAGSHMKHGHVSYNYRSGGGSGEVVGRAKGGTKNDPMESIRPDKKSRHPGEPKLIHRRASKLHKG